MDVHKGGRDLHCHGADVEPGHDALYIGSVVGREFDDRFDGVDGTVLAVVGIGTPPDEGDERVLDLEVLIDLVECPEQTGRITGNDTGELSPP